MREPKEFPYKIKVNYKNVYQGKPCTVLVMHYKGFGAEYIDCLISQKGRQFWVPFMSLKFQCCSECGI